MQVGIAGEPNDTIMKKTKTLEDNWIPTWNEEFEFPLTVPELALLRVEVHEYDMSDKDDFGGQTCLPVSELREGIRAVPLHNHKGVKYNSVRLLMRFQFIWRLKSTEQKNTTPSSPPFAYLVSSLFVSNKMLELFCWYHKESQCCCSIEMFLYIEKQVLLYNVISIIFYLLFLNVKINYKSFYYWLIKKNTNK